MFSHQITTNDVESTQAASPITSIFDKEFEIKKDQALATIFNDGKGTHLLVEGLHPKTNKPFARLYEGELFSSPMKEDVLISSSELGTFNSFECYYLSFPLTDAELIELNQEIDNKIKEFYEDEDSEEEGFEALTEILTEKLAKADQIINSHATLFNNYSTALNDKAKSLALKKKILTETSLYFAFATILKNAKKLETGILPSGLQSFRLVATYQNRVTNINLIDHPTLKLAGK